MSKPRVLFITPLPPPVHGSAIMSERIRQSELLGRELKMDFVNLSTSRKISEIQKKSLWLYFRKFWRFSASFCKALVLLCTHRYDLCYLAITCYGAPFLKDFPFVMLCKLFCKKVVIHQHNKGMSSCVHKWPYSFLMPLAYRNTKVILLSGRLYPDVSEVVREDQVMICPNGIPRVDSEGGTHAASDQPRLLFLSNLIASKGVYTLLDACKILKDRHIEFVCDFVGSESKEITADRFGFAVRERGLENCVKYHGPRYGNDKERFWNDADIFILPSFDECFSLVIIEAMQHSLPVISTFEGGIPDMVVDGETGKLCPQKDVDALADAIELLLSDADMRREMGQCGYERYQSLFTIEQFESTILDCLQSSALP